MEGSLHYVFEFIGLTTGVLLYSHSPISDAVAEQDRLHLILGAGAGALLGSRLVAVLLYPEWVLHPPSPLFYYGTQSIIGAIAGGIIGLEAVKKWKAITSRTGDRVLVPLIAGITIGRIGCFLTGVSDGTVGGPCDYWWCLEQGDGILRHPNSLYEIAFMLTFLLVYLGLQRLRPTVVRWLINTPGASFRTFIVLYFSLRFSIEFLKEVPPLALGINSIQIVCLIFIIWYARDLLQIYRRTQRSLTARQTA